MTLTGESFIAGRWQAGGGRPLPSTNPVTGETIWEGTFTDRPGTDLALAGAARAQADWQRRPFEERQALVERFAGIAAERKEELARLISTESAKALWDARTEAGAVSGKAALSVKAYHERTPTRDEGATRLSHRAHGVMVVIGPFNFPAHLPNGHIMPALLAGNAVILKPSEQTPAVAELMVRWWEEAGAPHGLVSLVHGGPAETQHLILDDRVAGIAFTGSAPAGLAIHRALAGHPEKILALELGGNNPLVVWEASDAEAVAKTAIRSAYVSAGQRCTCARRLVLPQGPDGDRYVTALADMLPKIAVGDPLAEEQPFYGGLISAPARAAALTAQQVMMLGGAEPIRPMEALAEAPVFVSPGLLDVTGQRGRRDEEVFAPLLQVVRVPTFEAALEEANATRFGLAAALLSDDEMLWTRFAEDIHAGIVNWNRQTTGASGAAPFGGPGLSGNHRPAGYYAADYCAWPMASMQGGGPLRDDDPIPGVKA